MEVECIDEWYYILEYLGVLYLFCGSGRNHGSFRRFLFRLSLYQVFIDLMCVDKSDNMLLFFLNGIRLFGCIKCSKAAVSRILGIFKNMSGCIKKLHNNINNIYICCCCTFHLVLCLTQFLHRKHKSVKITESLLNLLK